MSNESVASSALVISKLQIFQNCFFFLSADASAFANILIMLSGLNSLTPHRGFPLLVPKVLELKTQACVSIYLSLDVVTTGN